MFFADVAVNAKEKKIKILAYIFFYDATIKKKNISFNEEKYLWMSIYSTDIIIEKILPD